MLTEVGCARAPANTPISYWALRGGGGNFGVVTALELRLHELGPEVFGLHVAYSIDDADRVLSGWRDAVADAPDELSTAGLVWSLPVVDELPEHLRGLHTSAWPACGRAIRPTASAPPSALRELAVPAGGHERAP